MAEGTRVGFHKGIVGEHSLSGYGPLSSVKRPVRTRMRGVVGAGGEKPPATRLCFYLYYQVVLLPILGTTWIFSITSPYPMHSTPTSGQRTYRIK